MWRPASVRATCHRHTRASRPVRRIVLIDPRALIHSSASRGRLWEPGGRARSPWVAPRGTAPSYRFCNRLRHTRQVICDAGGSAHLEPLPGSTAQSAIRQFGVTA